MTLFLEKVSTVKVVSYWLTLKISFAPKQTYLLQQFYWWDSITLPNLQFKMVMWPGAAPPLLFFTFSFSFSLLQYVASCLLPSFSLPSFTPFPPNFFQYFIFPKSLIVFGLLLSCFYSCPDPEHLQVTLLPHTQAASFSLSHSHTHVPSVPPHCVEISRCTTINQLWCRHRTALWNCQ